MPQNKIEDLRNHLFAQLERLSDDDLKNVDIDEEVKRAGAIINVADAILRSAEAETEFLRVAAEIHAESKFFEVTPKAIGEGEAAQK